MAMLKCKECGNAVSTKAATCPKCGAPLPKQTSMATWVIGGVFALSVGSCILRQNEAETKKAAIPPPPPPSPAQLAEKARKDREINIVLAGAQRLKNAMKKPETFELTRAIMIEGKVICYEYVARNSFNDRAPGHYVISDTVSSDRASDWNKLCAGKSGDDYTSVRAVMQ